MFSSNNLNIIVILFNHFAPFELNLLKNLKKKEFMSTIKIYKTRNVQTPMRGTELSAGIDLFIPVDLTLQELSNVQPVKGMANVQYQSPSGIITEYILEPQRRILLPSGIKCKFPKGHCGLLVDKSGVSSKSGLTLLAKLIDEDYQGEIHINLINTSAT